MEPVEAIVLHSLPFKEYDRILTLFSPQGLLKMFVKGRKKEFLHLAALTSPLTHGEFHYTQGRKDLHRFVEGSILHQHLALRERYESLLAAEEMLRALQCSQWPETPTPHLFTLLSLLLKALPQVPFPHSLVTLFLIKLLRHEGLLDLVTPCTASYRFKGERYLTPLPYALPFTASEEELLTLLALTRSLAEVKRDPLPSEFSQKIHTLFTQAFHAPHFP